MIREAVKVVKAGAADYLAYPIEPEEVKHVLQSLKKSLLELSELEYLREEFWEKDVLKTIHTLQPKMKAVFKKIRSVAPTKSTVLLTGETGTGKGVMARLIHRHSNRRNAQFIEVHCGAIPDTLLESELFGHEKGAFTGAINRKLGKFELASGGTIFLDEIGTMTSLAQIKLLQVLEEGTFERIGGEATLRADTRIIAATNADLEKMCQEGQFRKDLFYRLNVFPIEIPPLRERPEDIPHLVRGILNNLNRFNSKEIRHVSPEALHALSHYSWPGNIRELENVLERAFILETSPVLQKEGFPCELFDGEGATASIDLDTSIPLAESRRRAVGEFERKYLTELLERNRGKIKESAEEAEITTRQLHKLLHRYGIRKEDYRPANKRTKKQE
jgi:DNA-binding NtrC family response regulator